jgi:hypothetical protein
MIKATSVNSTKLDLSSATRKDSGLRTLAKKPTQTTNDGKQLLRVIKEEAGEEVMDFISGNVSLLKYQETILFTSKYVNLYEHVNFNNIRTIINFQEVNKHEKINSFFRAINTLLPDAGIYIGCVETYDIRKRNMNARFGEKFTKALWGLDFIFNRVMPRMPLTKKLYFLLTKNKYRVLSLAETLGRLVYCGFDIIEYKEINKKIYFSAIKIKEPRFDSEVSYGPFFPMKRIGKNGKLIKVYKLRTMHPYSEFLQSFILKINGYNELGKPANDFRLTGWGRIFRKLWLDELPQLINLFKGELNVVGVRPLSQTRYNQFPEDIKKERIKYKPGCIPPYVALRMPDAEGNIEAERIYLREMQRRPYTTNVKFFFMAVFNILTHRIHSA